MSRRCREAVGLLMACILCIAVMVGIKAVKWMQGQTIVPGADQVMGMAIVDGGEILAGKEKAAYEENPGVCYEDVLLPFDESGLLYLAQNMEEDWTGRLSSDLKSFHVYAMQDDYWNRKQDAIRENHAFTLWLVGEESYYEIGLVVSGMPVIAIQTSRSEEAPEVPSGGVDIDPDILYYRTNVMYYGTIDVFNPKINTAKYEILQAHVRYHYKGATSAFFEKKSYSLSLQNYKEENIDASLLGMRMDNNWKLNALFNDPSRIREMTATQIWEEFDEANSSVNEAGARMEYVELILDNCYQGLYALVEPVDEKKLNLDRNDILYKVTDWGIPTDADIVEAIEKQWRSRYDIRIRYPEAISDFSIAWFPERDYLNAFYRGLNLPYEDIIAKVDISNIVDKQMFVMATSAQDNTHKNTYLAAKVDTPGNYVVYQVPWDFDLTFGNYFNSDAHNSRAYNPDYTVVYKEPALTTLSDANPDEVGDYIMSRWRECRRTFLDTEHILDLMTDNWDWLVDTGAALRERNRWPEEEIDTDIDYLLDYQIKRMEWLDWYFGE